MHSVALVCTIHRNTQSHDLAGCWVNPIAQYEKPPPAMGVVWDQERGDFISNRSFSTTREMHSELVGLVTAEAVKPKWVG